MEHSKEILEFIKNGIYQLNQALALSPKKSNLSDDLASVIETADEIRASVEHEEIDAAGMYV